MKKTVCAISAAAVLALGLVGCGASYEGTGSKDAATAEQLELRVDDPWAQEVVVDETKKAEGSFIDGVYVGVGKGMDGLISVTLQVQDNRITCIEVTQEGETQSVGGFEAIRDGKYAALIDAAQSADIDGISGATITTNGVKTAVEDALTQATEGTHFEESVLLAAKAGASVFGIVEDGTDSDDAE